MPLLEIRALPPPRPRHNIVYPVIVKVAKIRAFAPKLIVQLRLFELQRRIRFGVGGERRNHDQDERESFHGNMVNSNHRPLREHRQKCFGAAHISPPLCIGTPPTAATSPPRLNLSSGCCSPDHVMRESLTACLCPLKHLLMSTCELPSSVNRLHRESETPKLSSRSSSF